MSLVVLHGALGSKHQFEPLLAALGPSTIFVEFHGHGTTADVEEPWSIDLFARQLEQVLEKMDRPRIFGYSMGGYVAIALALSRPDLMSSIVTLGTKFEWSPEGSACEVKKLDAATIEAKVPAYAADLQRRHGADRWEELLEKTAALMMDLGTKQVLTPVMMANIEIPIHYGIGDRDEMVSIEETKHMYRSTPGATFAVFPSRRHPIEKAPVPQLVAHIESVR